MIDRAKIADCLLGASKGLIPVYVFKEQVLDDIIDQVVTGSSSSVLCNEHIQNVKQWCEDVVGSIEHDWIWDGATVYSYKVLFAKAEDAMAFKLRFGL